MCWSKESSFMGFIVNSILIYFHKGKSSSKFIPIFVTVALTQLFDFLVYNGGDKILLSKLLTLDLVAQVFFLYNAMNLPSYSYVLPLYLFMNTLNWSPYRNYNSGSISWNEGDDNKYKLAFCWILVPMIFNFNKKNKKDFKFLINSFILLFLSDGFNFGSVGKNWCMLGVLLSFITLLEYNDNQSKDIKED